jgi:hypothetical protein
MLPHDPTDIPTKMSQPPEKAAKYEFTEEEERYLSEMFAKQESEQMSEPPRMDWDAFHPPDELGC